MQQDTLQHIAAPQPHAAAAKVQGQATPPAPADTLAAAKGKKMGETVGDTLQFHPITLDETQAAVPLFLEKDVWANGTWQGETHAALTSRDSLAGRPLTAVAAHPTGVAGDPAPFLFRNDHVVTLCLLVSFLLVVWVVTNSRHYLNAQIKDFFRERKRENMFAERTQTELRGQVFLVFQTCFALGLLFFDFVQERQTDVFNQVSPYLILGTAVGLCSLYYVAKTCLYSFVNGVFFERAACRRFSEVYMSSVLALGLVLLPLALAVVYFDLDFERLVIAFIVLLSLDKVLLLYKTWHIFFNRPWGAVHLFLYFCTLEAAPMLVLFQAMVYVNRLLLTFN